MGENNLTAVSKTLKFLKINFKLKTHFLKNLQNSKKNENILDN